MSGKAVVLLVYVALIVIPVVVIFFTVKPPAPPEDGQWVAADVWPHWPDRQAEPIMGLELEDLTEADERFADDDSELDIRDAILTDVVAEQMAEEAASEGYWPDSDGFPPYYGGE